MARGNPTTTCVGSSYAAHIQVNEQFILHPGSEQHPQTALSVVGHYPVSPHRHDSLTQVTRKELGFQR